MDMVESDSGPELSAEEEMALIRDSTVAAEAHAKEGDIFFLVTNRCALLIFIHLLSCCCYLSYRLGYNYDLEV
jgi:hypothetical protein